MTTNAGLRMVILLSALVTGHIHLIERMSFPPFSIEVFVYTSNNHSS